MDCETKLHGSFILYVELMTDVKKYPVKKAQTKILYRANTFKFNQTNKLKILVSWKVIDLDHIFPSAYLFTRRQSKVISFVNKWRPE